MEINLAILYIFILVAIYNLIYHKNYTLIFFICIFIYIIYYQEPLINDQIDYNKKMKQLIDSLMIDREKYIQTNKYSLYKLPNKFRYIYLNKNIIKELYNMRFIVKFNEDIYVKKLIMIEKFLKTYYNIISGRYE
jgi:hypothetical protein